MQTLNKDIDQQADGTFPDTVQLFVDISQMVVRIEKIPMVSCSGAHKSGSIFITLVSDYFSSGGD